MKSKVLFVLTMICFFNPMAVMADQKSNYAGDLKVGCNKWAEKRLKDMNTSSSEEKLPLSSGGSSKIVGSAR